METQTKILLGFILIIFLSLAQVTTGLIMQLGIMDNARQVTEVESPLEFMAREIVIHDSMLTGKTRSALIYAYAGDYEMVYESKAKYDVIAEELDYLLGRDIRILLRQSRRSEDLMVNAVLALDEIERINRELVELERKAFEAILEEDFDTAFDLIAGEEYNTYKDEFYRNYKEFADIEHQVTTEKRSDVFRIAERLIIIDFLIAIFITFAVIATLFVIRSFITKLKEKYAKKK